MTLSLLKTPSSLTRTTDNQRYLKIAADVAHTLREDVVARDHANTAPVQQVQLLRESGLLPLNIPTRYGGAGLDWNQCLEIVQTIARADNSIGQLLGYHYIFQAYPYLDLSEDIAQKLASDTIENGWFYSSTGTPQGNQVQAKEVDGGWIINGKKPFATGSYVADKIYARVFTGDNRRVVLLVDTSSDGIIRHDDWDVLGSRLTATNSIEFQDVFVPASDTIGILPLQDVDRRPSQTLSTPSFQLLFATVYLAAAEGAVLEALDYTRSSSRPWFHATVQNATEDPYILHKYGEFVSQLQALSAIVQQATDALDWAISQGENISWNERASVAELVAVAKTNAHRVSLDITERVFDVTGARATGSKYGLDRHWRDVRTHTLHDPVAYKYRELGNYLLNGVAPPPSAYQ